MGLHPRPRLRQPRDPLLAGALDDLAHGEILALGVAPVEESGGDPDLVGYADEGHGGS